MELHGNSDGHDDTFVYRNNHDSDEATILAAKPLNPASFTHPSVLNNGHIDSFQEFIDDVNCALAGALSRNGSIYRKASVLFLRWEDDVFIESGINNGVQGEIDSLEKVFVHDYGFDTELYLIPSHNSQRSLQKKIFHWQEEHDSRQELLVVYYGGHGVLNDMNQSIWAQGQGPTVDWFSIQHLLEYAVPDVVIFLDCCYAASADLRSVDGTMEILAACGREVNTVGISDWSFTSRLTELLHDLRDQHFTIVQLHSKLMNYRAAEGPKKLLRTPHHGIMSNKDKASIRLSTMVPRSDVTSLDGTELTISEGSEPNGAASSRVLVAVSWRGNDPHPSAWSDWLLSHLPGGIDGLSLVRPEGIWGAHSILGLFSLPAAVWDLLPNRFAYTFVGFVRTSNMIGREIASGHSKSIDVVARALTGRNTRLFESHGAEACTPSFDPSIVPTIKPEDIVIAVMGITGAGKSSFIATASGKQLKTSELGLGNQELTSAPALQQVRIVSFQYEGRNVHLIDTPGFDGTSRSDTEALKEITYWLSSAYVYDVCLSGIIHLHPITNPLMTDSALKRRLRVLQKTWGTRILPSVAMVTTMWDIIKSELGEKQENHWRRSLWQPIVEHGGYVARHNNTRSSALSIIDLFMTKGKATLEIQHEMVDQHMMLKDTAVGRELISRFDMLSAEKNAKIAALGVNIEQLVAAKEKEFQESLARDERRLGMELLDTYYAKRNELRTVISSHRYLHQVVIRGIVGTSTAAEAAACVVM